ncbi:MAG: 50S ribosomal protein L29 [Chloroflexi bacterium]|nr:50S ribosomal protein L29 [Chloroflexota bacterium]MCH7999053.1 50S ribosomal protein L29 [Chloroflexota bacterium]MCH8920008.1 50S ribosomal protein L29 [Chloroflexota bacterium]
MAKKLKEKTEEIRKLSDEDVEKELEEAHRRLFSLRLQSETRQITNHRELPAAKRLIARLKTIQRERQLAAVREAQ